MSMPAWLNDVSTVPNNDNGAFNPSVDPTMAFMQTPTSATFDFNQFQNSQVQQRMQNGTVRNGSPAYLNPAYQTQPVVPSKRPRPREDIYNASPRQAPGALPSSRSQTPQQSTYPNIHSNVNGGQSIQAPAPYQHLQHGVSNNASPSPILQDQNYNPHTIPQRMQTASPSPFSPVGQSYGSQASPPQSDYGSRVDTPQNGTPHYPQNMSHGGAPAQYFPPPPSSINGNPSSGPSSYAQNNPNLQRMYDMRQQQLFRQPPIANTAAQPRIQGSGLNPLANPSVNYENYQQAARAQQLQQSASRPINPEHFVKGLFQFMHRNNQPWNTNPTVGGRPIPLQQLCQVVMRSGGSRRITVNNQWQGVAASLQLLPAQFPNAVHELQNYWAANISLYEAEFLTQRQRAINSQIPVSHRPQRSDASSIPEQFSPVKQLNSHHQDQSAMQHARRQSQQADYQTPVKQIGPHPRDIRQPLTNGFSTPHQPSASNQQHSAYSMSQSVLSMPPQVTPPHMQSSHYPAPGSSANKKESYSASSHTAISHPDPVMPRKAPMGPHFLPKFQPLEKGKDGVESHGGIQVSTYKDVVDQLLMYKPNVPAVVELGLIDIRALTMSLRSGIHAEVRVALDTLATLSSDKMSPDLESCEDLVETLIDCADDQLDMLAENAAEVSDVMLISPYEEVIRGCRSEIESLQDVPVFGTLDYDLDRSAERLICITTILRNFSFFEANHPLLADPVVVKFMTTVIRYLGTRNMLLRTYRNTLDITKDIITYLSNLSHKIDLPGREEASCMLHFLLSFAPSPSPTAFGAEEIMFSSFNPSIHRYLPPAVDSLAKFLARDDPNRTFYKSIFAADGASTPPYDLLTRTFALAIAPIPEPVNEIMAVVRVRQPYLVQGMLAADILVTLIPGSEHALARSWLNSRDGFATNLLQLVSRLSRERVPPSHRHPAISRPGDAEVPDYDMITHRGIAVLWRLAEKAKDSDEVSGGPHLANLTQKDTLLEALMSHNIDSNVVRQLCVYAGLES